jgi:ABC-type Fe3+ transport system permease subunit/DNA-binding beta-propeller fold protein YncE
MLPVTSAEVPARRPSRREPRVAWSIPVWAVVLTCCALPLGWMAVQVARVADRAGALLPTRFYLGLLGRTLAYSVAAALLATLLAIPAALVLGRGRGPVARALWLLLPATLLLPSITYAYGWSQLLRLLDLTPDFASSADVLRCVWTIAAWLWAIPAGVLGLALRRVDVNLQQQALLDGALGRLTARLLLAPAVASVACVAVLAGQEFAVYEPTGISVVATEVRQVFETGAFASLDNPMTAPFISGGSAAADDGENGSQDPGARSQEGEAAGAAEGDGADAERPLAPSPGTPGEGRGEGLSDLKSGISNPRSQISDPKSPALPQPPPGEGYQGLGLRDQDARAGAAVATSLPLVAVVVALGGVAAWGVRRVSAAGDEMEVGPWPKVLEAGVVAKSLALLVLVVTLVTPAAAMLASLHVWRGPLQVWRQFSPQATGSVVLGACAALVAAAVAFLAAVRWPRGAVWVSLAAFLIGGQLLAIALIRLYNRPAPWPIGLVQFGGGGPTDGARGGPAGGGRDAFDLIYNGIPIVVMAYLARFGWLALMAAGFTRARPWRQVRELAALDGATPAQAARHVIWPLAWPVLVAAALLVGVLALTEVPATVLISPLRPQPLVPLLMGWVHMLRYDDMIQGSLLLMAMAMVAALAAAGLIALGVRVLRGLEARNQEPGAGRKTRLSVLFWLVAPGFWLLSTTGCSDPAQPDAIWMETGTGPGQVVYPRAITYSSADDSFFVVDRLARIQHLDSKGHPLNEWRMPDWRVGKPVGLSVGPDGNVYVPDTHYHRVVVYSPQGQQLRTWGERGTGPGQFIWPTDVAFDAAGSVYVTEYGDHDRIQVFAPDGTYQRAFAKFGEGDGQLSRPQSLVIDGGLVYVADGCNHRIAVFRTDGTFVRNMGTMGSGPGQFRYPYGLDIDPAGRLVVCEFGNNRVQLVDKQTGQGLGVWGAPGREPGQLAYPWAVALDRNGRVVTVDSGNNRLQVFEF